MSLAEPTATAVRMLGTHAVHPKLGLFTTLQLVPFHCSVSVWREAPWISEYPTAQTLLAEAATTPNKWLYLPPGLGLVTTFQAPQFSAAAWATFVSSTMVSRSMGM